VIEKQWPAMLEELAEGGIISKMVSRYDTTVHKLRAYRALNPKANAEWEAAWTASADALYDRVLTIVEQLEEQSDGMSVKDVKAARVQIQALYWLAGKRNPRVYGDHKTLDVNMSMLDMTAIIHEATARRDKARNEMLGSRGNPIDVTAAASVEDLL